MESKHQNRTIIAGIILLAIVIIVVGYFVIDFITPDLYYEAALRIEAEFDFADVLFIGQVPVGEEIWMFMIVNIPEERPEKYDHDRVMKGFYDEAMGLLTGKEVFLSVYFTMKNVDQQCIIVRYGLDLEQFGLKYSNTDWDVKPYSINECDSLKDELIKWEGR